MDEAKVKEFISELRDDPAVNLYDREDEQYIEVSAAWAQTLVRLVLGEPDDHEKGAIAGAHDAMCMYERRDLSDQTPDFAAGYHAAYGARIREHNGGHDFMAHNPKGGGR
jgi:hypothetical protein